MARAGGDSSVRYRILSVGKDLVLLNTRQAVLASAGYDSVAATPENFDEKVSSKRFDLVIFSAMLSEQDKRLMQAKLPVGTRSLLLNRLMYPSELLQVAVNALACY